MTNIYQKLFNIMSSIQELEKDKTNEFHKYNYLSEYAIKKALRQEMIKNKVMLKVDPYKQKEIVYGKDNENILTRIYINYYFIDIESGESIAGTFIGSGQDKGDKGTYKAITGAIKYILTSTFLIPSGEKDDPEYHKETKNDNDEIAL